LLTRSRIIWADLQSTTQTKNQKPYVDNSFSCFNNVQHYNNYLKRHIVTPVSSVASPSATTQRHC